MLNLKRKLVHGAASVSLIFVLLTLVGRFDCAAAPGEMPAISLSWNASQDPNVAGYAIYYGTNSGSYTTRIDAGTNTTDSITNLTTGTEYFFSVTAYNTAGIESPSSNEIAVTVPNLLQLNMGTNPAAGVTLGFTAVAGHSYELQATTDFQNWTTIWQSSVASQTAWTTYQDNPQGSSQRFYRLVVH